MVGLENSLADTCISTICQQDMSNQENNTEHAIPLGTYRSFITIIFINIFSMYLLILTIIFDNYFLYNTACYKENNCQITSLIYIIQM